MVLVRFFIWTHFGDPLGPPNRPRTITYGLWGRPGLHQSLLEQNSYPQCYALRRNRVPQGPRSPLRFGGEDLGRKGVLIAQAATQGADQIDNRFANHGAWQIDRAGTHLFENGHIIGRDHAADDDHNVTAAFRR